MKKIIYILLLLPVFVTAQKLKADVVKFDSITSTVRDTYTVPYGEYWVIFNGTTGQFEYTDGSETWTPFGTGDVAGPASSTDNAIARFDSTTGKIIQNSGTTLSDAGILTMAGGINSQAIYPDADDTRSIGTSSNRYVSVYSKQFIFNPLASDPTFVPNLGQTFYRSDLGKISFWDGSSIQRLATESGLSSYATLSGDNSFTGTNDFVDGYFTRGQPDELYIGAAQGENTKRWYFSKTTGPLRIGYQNTAATDYTGSYTQHYTLNETGVPVNGTDLVNKSYVDGVDAVKLDSIVQDLTPELGGNLDAGGYNISNLDTINGVEFQVNTRLNIPVITGDPASYVKGDIWYNDTADEYRGSNDAGDGVITFGGASGSDSGQSMVTQTKSAVTETFDNSDVTNGGGADAERMFTKFSGLSEITLDATITRYNQPFLLLHNSASDSTLVKKGTSTTFIMEGNGTLAEDGFYFKNYTAPTVIALSSNEFFIAASSYTPWTEPASFYYDTANAMNPDNEANATTGLTCSNCTITSITSDVQNGTYSIEVTVTANGQYYLYADLPNTNNGDSVNAQWYLKRVSGGNYNQFPGMNTADGWATSDNDALWSGSLSAYTATSVFTATANADDPDLRILNASGTAGDVWRVDNLIISQN